MAALIDVRIQCDGCTRTTIEPATSAWRARARLSQVGWRRIAGKDLCPSCILEGRIFHMPSGHRPERETMCPVCDRMVGVFVTPFNGRANPKVSRHHRPGTGDQRIWCRGGGLAISASAIIPATAYGERIKIA